MNTFKVKGLQEKKTKPSIFIGSSTESLVVAKAVKSFFEAEKYEVDIWDEDIFDPTIQMSASDYQINEKLQRKLDQLGISQKPKLTEEGIEEVGKSKATNLDSLKNFSDIYDFAIFIFVPEDKIVSQSRVIKTDDEMFAQSEATRHNVVFEFGLFLGRIGSKKTFIIADHHTHDFINNFFTDLKGIKLFEYQGDYSQWLQSDDLNILPYDKASLKEQVDLVKKEIEATKINIDLGFLPSTALAIGYFENLLKLVIANLNDLLARIEQNPNITVVRVDKTNKDFKETFQVDLSGRKIKFNIVTPDALIGASHDEYKKQIEALGLLNVTVPSPTRPFTLFCHPDILKEGTPLVIYDIPSTMFSSSKAIDMLTEVKDIRELLDEKEKRNFKKAVEYLIQKEKTNPAVAGIENMVSIVSLQVVKYDFGASVAES